MTRRRIVSSLLVVALAIALAAASPPAEPAAAGKPADPRAKKLEKVHFSGVPLEDVVEFLRDMTGSNIVVKWNVLEAAGVDRDTPVNLKVKDVPKEKILKLVLEAVGQTGIPLGYELEDNIVTISTADDLARKTETVTYDVRELIDWTEPKQLGGLLDVIRSSIDPDSWSATGGGPGSVCDLNGALVVRHNRRVHEALALLLEDLRASQAKPLTSPRARAQQTAVKIRMVGDMKQTCLDPAAMALIAVAGLRDEVPRDADEVIKEFEDLLGKVESVGVRNAIRLALKDLYKLKGDHKKVLYHLRMMLIENAGAVAVKRKDAVRGSLFGLGRPARR